MSLNFPKKMVAVCILSTLALSSCFFVKYNDNPDVKPSVALSPKPEIAMASEIIRSNQGDMISYIPKDWFLIDIDDRKSSGIIAVAVNPEYSLSAVFSLIRSNNILDQTIEKEGVLGLARMSLERHKRKTAGDIKLMGQYQEITLGTKNFVRYKMSTTGGALSTDVVVFKTTTGNYYEFALIPMDVLGKPLPAQPDIDKIFNSIVASIQFN